MVIDMNRFIIPLIAAGSLFLPSCEPAHPTPPAAPEVALQKAVRFPALIAKDRNGRAFWICESAQRLVQTKLPSPAHFPKCVDNFNEQVHYGEDGRYAIRSWVDIPDGRGAKVRTPYDGEALVPDESGEARTFQITRLDLH
jgi:hypothetical protein